MKSAWVDGDAQAIVDRYAREGGDLALRIYTTRLLGRDPKLVLHGGGNTSVKTWMTDLLGEEVGGALRQGLRRGHGDDRARRPAGGAARPAAQAACARRRSPMRTWCGPARESARSDGAKPFGRDAAACVPAAQIRRSHPFDRGAEHRSISRTAKRSRRDVLRQRMAIVPYIMPGFALAKKAAEVFDAAPKVEGLILHKHGIFTFGETAREAYERMIEMVTLRRGAACARTQERVRDAQHCRSGSRRSPTVAPILRGACELQHEKTKAHGGGWCSISASGAADP